MGILTNSFIIVPPASPEVLYDEQDGTTTGTNNADQRGFGNKILAGQSDLVGATLTKVGFKFKNLSGGTITIGVWDNDSADPSFTFGTITSTTSSFALYERENLTGYTLSANQIIAFKVSGTFTVSWERYNGGTGADPNVAAYYFNTPLSPNWQEAGDHQDLNMIVEGFPP
tara:strand:+ start:3063 stop:3575 length:513 start_codon:yes stop_codon:yes gene_type:complete